MDDKILDSKTGGESIPTGEFAQNLRVLDGGLSGNFGKAPRRYMGAWVTDTRLMGVCVLCARWRINASYGTMYQIQYFYMDWHGGGLERYEGLAGETMDAIIEDSIAIDQSMAGGLGGKRNNITEREMRRLVQEFVEYNIDRNIPLPEGHEQFEFLLSPPSVMTEAETKNLTKKICCKLPNTFSIINYFLLRCFEKDFDGAKLLLGQYVRTNIFADIAAGSIMKNSIVREQDSSYHKTNDDPFFNTFKTRRSYVCETLVLTDTDEYHLLKTRVILENLRVVGYERLDSMDITLWEAATMLEETEYVTVFNVDCSTADFDMYTMQLLSTAMYDDNSVGRLFSIYYPNNDYMQKCVYYMRDDLYGLCYVLKDQILVSSTELMNIKQLERELMDSKYLGFLRPVTRFQFNHSIVQDFIDSGYDDFLLFLKDIGAGE